NGFSDLKGIEQVALVAGGIGQPPFLAYIRELVGQRGYGGLGPRREGWGRGPQFGGGAARPRRGGRGFRGARGSGRAGAGRRDAAAGGVHGFVTQRRASHAAPSHLVGCGPEAMMKALAVVAQKWLIPCQLSLEAPMACGVGICFSCVTKVRVAEGWDYRRVCVDGPVFEASSLAWQS